jgi:hypothetical protein
MAYVAISGELLNRVEEKINKMRTTEKMAIKEPPNSINVSANDATALQIVWGDQLAIKDLMRPAWKRKTSNISLRVEIKMDHDSNNAHFQINTTNGEQFEVPCEEASSSYGSFTVRYNTEEECPPIMAESIAYTKVVTEIDSRWVKIKKQVKEFLSNCKSLNEALKLWPDLRLYIPQTYIDRMEKNSPSAKKQAEESAALKALQSIDTDFLVAAAVGARMTQAAVGQSHD